MENIKLYEKIDLALTWYEQPEAYPDGEPEFNKHIAREFYNLLVEVKEKLFKH